MKLEEEVVKKLKECNCLLTTAESCTGGMVASSIVNVSGAYFTKAILLIAMKLSTKYLVSAMIHCNDIKR